MFKKNNKISELEDKIKSLEKLLSLQKSNDRSSKEDVNQQADEKSKIEVDKFISSLLSPLINLDQLININGDVSEEVKNWLKGIKIVNKEFLKVLNKQGIEIIEPKIGDNFNSKEHEVIEYIESKEANINKIIDVASIGFKSKDKILIYSKVRVGKKGE